MTEQNRLVSFPSFTDPLLRVSSLPLDHQVKVIDYSFSENVSFFDFRDILYDLPKRIPSIETPYGVEEIRLSNKTRDKIESQLGRIPKYLKQPYMNAIACLLGIICNSLVIEEHRDRMKNKNGDRFHTNPSDPNVLKVQRLFSPFSTMGSLYRVKTTVKVFKDNVRSSRHHGYDLTEIELLNRPWVFHLEGDDQAMNNNSISIANLLNNIELSYEPGIKITEAMKSIRTFLSTNDDWEMLQLCMAAYEDQVVNTSIIKEAEEKLGKDWRTALSPHEGKDSNKQTKGFKL